MSNAALLDPLTALPHAAASDVKKLGWRGVMKTVRSAGSVVVTNHSEPEAVILSTEEYTRLVKLAEQAAPRAEDALTALRADFDRRLAALNAPDAADRLRNVMRGGAKLEGKVKAGTGH